MRVKSMTVSGGALGGKKKKVSYHFVSGPHVETLMCLWRCYSGCTTVSRSVLNITGYHGDAIMYRGTLTRLLTS